MINAGFAAATARLVAGADAGGPLGSRLSAIESRQEAILADEEEKHNRHDALVDGLKVLNARERRIFEARRLAEDPITLEQLSDEFNISRERVRQLEKRLQGKIKTYLEAQVERGALE